MISENLPRRCATPVPHSWPVGHDVHSVELVRFVALEKLPLLHGSAAAVRTGVASTARRCDSTIKPYRRPPSLCGRAAKLETVRRSRTCRPGWSRCSPTAPQSTSVCATLPRPRRMHGLCSLQRQITVSPETACQPSNETVHATLRSTFSPGGRHRTHLGAVALVVPLSVAPPCSALTGGSGRLGSLLF